MMELSCIPYLLRDASLVTLRYTLSAYWYGGGGGGEGGGEHVYVVVL